MNVETISIGCVRPSACSTSGAFRKKDLVVLHDLHAIAERIAEVEARTQQQVDPLGGERAPRALLVVDDEPEVPVLAGAGREQRDELIAQVEEGATVRALHAPELEQPAVERDRAVHIVDLERNVVDAHRARAVSIRSHGTTVGVARSEFPGAIGPRTRDAAGSVGP